MQENEQEVILLDWLSRHRGLLVKVARAFVRSTADQDDLLQEIALQVWNSIPRYKKDTAETTWLYRVAFHTAINWSRKVKSRDRVLKEYQEQLALFHREQKDDPRVEWLYEQIGELPTIDRSLALLMLDGFSYREMSETLGITESNVGVRVNRIKKRLSKQLEKEKNHDL